MSETDQFKLAKWMGAMDAKMSLLLSTAPDQEVRIRKLELNWSKSVGILAALTMALQGIMFMMQRSG